MLHPLVLGLAAVAFLATAATLILVAKRLTKTLHLLVEKLDNLQENLSETKEILGTLRDVATGEYTPSCSVKELQKEALRRKFVISELLDQIPPLIANGINLAFSKK